MANEVLLNLKADISDLDKKLDAAEKELQDVSVAFDRATDTSKQATAAADDYTDAVQNAGGSTGKFSQLIFSSGDALQDFSVAGLRGASNNLAFMAEGLTQAADEAGGFKNVIGGLSSALLGPAGAVLALQGLLVALPRIVDAFSEATVESEKFQEQLDKLESTAARLFEVTGRVAGVEIGPSDFGTVARAAEEEIAGLGITLQSAEEELAQQEAALSRLQQRYQNSAPLSDYRAEVGEQIETTKASIASLETQITRLRSEQDEWRSIQKEVKAAREEFERALKIRQKLQQAAGPGADFGQTRASQAADVQAAAPAGQDLGTGEDLGTVNAETVRLAGNFDALARKAGIIRDEMQRAADQATLAFQVGRRSAALFGAGVGDVVSRVLTLDSSITSVTDAMSELGEVGRRVLQDLIRQFASAAAQAAALRGVASVFSLGSVGSFGSLFKGFLGLAHGGPVAGPGTSRSDSIPALLSDGEFVVNAKSASAAAPVLQAINADPGFAQNISGAIQGLASGGFAGAMQGLTQTPQVRMPRAPSRGLTVQVKGGFDVSLDELRFKLDENAALYAA